MHREIMCKEDVLNSDNVGSAMLNLTEITDDMEGLKQMLIPLSRDGNSELLPHIVRSLESYISDINEVYSYLDQICLNENKKGRC